MSLLETVPYAVAASMVYSLVWYSRSHLAKGEEFDPVKFAATVMVGAGVGVALGMAGGAYTEATIAEQFALYIGVISVVEAVLKSMLSTTRYAEGPPQEPKAQNVDGWGRGRER